MIDHSSAVITDTWQFKPFHVPATGKPLRSLALPADDELILIERNGEWWAFSMQEMAYHHVSKTFAPGGVFSPAGRT